jgi:hypothetical protein
MKTSRSILSLVLVCLLFSTGCTPGSTGENQKLSVSLLYPTETTEIKMGQSFKGIVKVTNEQGKVVENAQVSIQVSDPDGTPVTSLSSTFGSGDVYRTESWIIPHKMQAGRWTLAVHAQAGARQGETISTFQVDNSVSEMLLDKYGFWIDSPSLRGIVPSLVKEQGDARNGVIIWGGVMPAQHVLPESWIEIQWRSGDFKLETADEVRNFMLNELGDLGFTPVRDLGPFEQVAFKGWHAWKIQARGQFMHYDEQWMIFYAPEVDETYALGTTVALPPSGTDAHAFLRDSFEVHPEVHAEGVAPQPLPTLLPPPEPVAPALGALFFGTEQPITLTWESAKELSDDEYYLVSIDYNYVESNIRTDFTTREMQFVLPEQFYQTPNCGVFNWRVTLMKQAGIGADGQPDGVPISFSSLYWYVEWRYPPGEAPFKFRCPNEQF